ncbi:MAG TPA: Rho termination factor [Jiangellaceae bacterium]|nr:Rho termination factor [Jiangellaceae bacterium]
MPRSSIKDEKTYQKLRRKGESKEKAARISNAMAAEGKSTVGRRGGKGGDYDDWTKTDLMKRAREIGIEGRSSMNKKELVKALRNH